jgi:hypothetical protein
LLAGFLCGAAARESLTSSEARRLIATVGGINLPKENVHIRELRVSGGRAIVEALVQNAFEFSNQEGRWEVSKVRVGDREWESVELVTTAVRKEKILRTTDDLREIAKAIEAFRGDRGFLPPARDFPALIDHLTPKYLPRVIREDYWFQSYLYTPMPDGYRIESLGPDGKPGSGDELVIENGQLLSSQKRGAK